METEQYVPDVSENDIERVIARDFSADTHAVIYEMVRQVVVREKTRVVLACLKNSNGNLEKLKGELENAGGWWREIISEAEYPNYTRKLFRVDKLPPDERKRIIEKDKNQYLTWLGSMGTNGKRKRT